MKLNEIQDSAHKGEANKRMFTKIMKNISQLTDINDHNEAVIQGLKFLGNDAPVKKLTKIMMSIKDVHDKQGFMKPQEASNRSKVMRDMESIAKKRLTPEQFKQFHMAF